MLLADRVVASGVLERVFGANYNSFVETMNASHKFVLSNDIAGVAHQLTYKTVAPLARGLSVCRTPFPMIWIEYETKARIDLMDVSDSKNRSLFKRVGFLVESVRQESCHFSASMFLESDAMDVVPCAVSISVDIRTDKNPQHAITNLAHQHQLAKLEEDAVAVARSILIESCKYLANKRPDTALIQSGIKQWTAQSHFLMIALALINSKNATENENVAISEGKNKLRRRMKRQPLYSHSLCKIRMSSRSRGDAGNGSHSSPRAHFVRGHFKMRKTGVYWWNAFGRGDVSRGIVTKEYRVQA